MGGADPLLGRVIANKFRVEELLGAGAMGRVYRAQQENLEKPVAIKVLHEKAAGDAQLERRFFLEAKHVSALAHPNIVQVIDFGREGDLLFIAMELLAGRDLGKVLKSDGVFSAERSAHIVGQVLSALEESHEKGMVHRDLKPENVMLVDVRGEPDFVKVCDFGIAKAAAEREAGGSAITLAGMVCGTPEYMSPEQARGEALDGRSDLYSVACLLYHAVCGEVPFRASTPLAIVTKHLHEAPVVPSQKRAGLRLPPAFEAVIARGLEKAPERRFATANEMREALYASVGIRRPTSGPRPRVPGTRLGEEATLELAQTGLGTPVSLPSQRSASTESAPLVVPGHYGIAICGDVMVSYWRKHQDDAARAQTAVWAQRLGARYRVMIVLESSALVPPSDDARRKAVADLKRTNDQVSAAAWILLGEGFKMAFARSTITGWNLLTRPKGPTKVFSTVTEGAEWLARQNGTGGAAADLVKIVDELRVALG